jgi:hypothetical protein
MHPDLQTELHMPQLVQDDLLSFILKIESLATKPRKVPAGHTELQYNLPFFTDNLITRISMNRENPNEIQLNPLRLTGYRV